MTDKYIYVSASEAKLHLGHYLKLVEQGKVVYIIRNSMIVAELKAAQYKEVVK